ncbi:MAG: glycosyltransferase family 4 protein [Anaerolineales bacterium]|jgi:glycosyltransferase involved in cell wall biosynthesis
MKILFVAGRELSYPRNDVILRALQRFGDVDVVGEDHLGSLSYRNFRLILRLIPKLLTKKHDLVFVGFYGHVLMLFAGTLSIKPVIFDAFVSTYDTLSDDRQIIRSSSIIGRLAFQLDRFSCRLADHILLDTAQHVDYFVDTFNISPDLFDALPVGCNESLFYPREEPSNDKVVVLYYTTYQPLHGVDVVIQAAKLLSAQGSLHFRLIGNGPEYEKVTRLIEKLELENVSLKPYLPIKELPEEIGSADILLGGHFGTSSKAGRVIPGKLYQILAMRRPMIAADSIAIRTLIEDGTDAILCRPGDPVALAHAIEKLCKDSNLRDHLKNNGRRLYETCCSESIITEKLKRIVDRVVLG